MKKKIIKICPGCGGHFNALRNGNIATYCSVFCSHRVVRYKHRHGGSLDGFFQIAARGTARWYELHDPKKLKAERMAKRDAEYAKFAIENVPVTIEERDKIVVENRGRVPAGFGAAAHVIHN